MRCLKYRPDFEALYPNYGPTPLMIKYGISRHYATQIAHRLRIRLLPRNERTCWNCPTPLKGIPTYTGNYCVICFNARRKKQEEVPELFIRTLFHRAKNRAGKKSIEFDLTQEHLLGLWVKQKMRCFYSDIPMRTNGRQRDPYGVSIDRVHPEKGYIIGNIVLCCWGVNTAKQEFTLSEFFNLCQGVSSNQRLKETLKLLDGGCPKRDPGGQDFLSAVPPPVL